MNGTWIIEEAKKNEERVIFHRRHLHETAEVGFDLMNTHDYVFNLLKELGCQPKKCGKMGIVAKIKGESENFAFLQYNSSINLDEMKEKKVTKNKIFSKKPYSILLRADMDALPIVEDTHLPFKSKNGCMHSCGHDMHTAMLLGACEILSKNKDKFASEITVLFQPAEEILEGAREVIESGMLDEASIDFGAMIHVLTDSNLDTGTLILSNSDITAPSADLFEIKISGKGAHGAMPQKTIDPILIGSHLILALEGLITRECAGINGTALTIGEFNGGKAPNVIPENVMISGTVRTYDEKARELLKKRINEIASYQAATFNGSASVSFKGGCPTFKNNINLSKSAYTCLKSAFSSLSGKDNFACVPSVIWVENDRFHSSLASEDFSYISHKIPSIMLALSAGKREDGYSYPLHNSKALFDEKALLYGTIAFCALGTGLK